MEENKVQFPNVSHLELPEATYTILYGMHIVEQNPEELPVDTDYLLLETGMHEYLKDPQHTIDRLSSHVQYNALFKKADKMGIPIVFADLKYKYNDFALLFLDNALSAAGWYLGTNLLKRSVKHGKNGDIRKATLNAIVAGWLIMPFAINALRLGSTALKIGEEKTNKLKRLSHRLHPETELLYLTLRNAVIAEKAKTLARIDKKKPHIAIVLGAGHVGIEDMLEMSDERRLALINRCRGILQYLARPEYLYTTLLGKKKGKDWQTSTLLTPSLQTVI